MGSVWHKGTNKMPTGRRNPPVQFGVAALILVTLVVAVAVRYGTWAYDEWYLASLDVQWQEFSARDIDAARRADKTVIIHVTADWMSSIKYPLATTFQEEAVRRRLNRDDVYPILLDVSNNMRQYADRLNAWGVRAVPETIVLPPDPADAPNLLGGCPNVETILCSLAESRGLACE